MDIVIENNKIVKVQNVGYPGIPINPLLSIFSAPDN